ncbi:MAG: UTP--glucose-1-phosphate uridylyltransferase [Lachnospiraceae bacterium]|nr:UTP--glucose-1-phosphate uridylyltransferase [Lachnospiraceae bacterium]
MTREEAQKLVEEYKKAAFAYKKKAAEEEGQIRPLTPLTIGAREAKEDAYVKKGSALMEQGALGLVLLAGGMGTRLGFDGPKGTLNIGRTRELYIFECLFNNLQRQLEIASEHADQSTVDPTKVPVCIMTSDKNDAATRAFFKEHSYFGYGEENVYFFTQEMAPACDYEGNLLMEDEVTPATSPNGNGGWYPSMKKAGLTEELKKRGVKWLNVFGVDNVLAKIADPVFLGAVVSEGKTCGSKAVVKRSPEEKVGVMCMRDNHPAIVEYYELSGEQAAQRNSDGGLTYGMGVILNYLFRMEDLDRIAGENMPVHLAEKKIPYMDAQGVFHKPQEPNGYKFEILITDLLSYMEDCLPYEVLRQEEFAPVKNKEGADSVESARELLEAAGVQL